MKKKIGELLSILSTLLLLVASPSFFIFLVYTVLLGGDAINGHIVGDQHFVCAHGECKEVWPIFYNISRYLGVLMISTFTPAIVFGMTSQWLLKDEASDQQDTQAKT